MGRRFYSILLLFSAAVASTSSRAGEPLPSSCASFHLESAIVSADLHTAFSVPGRGEIDPSRVPWPILAHYRATVPHARDGIGDYAVLRAAHLTPERIKWFLLHKKEKFATTEQDFNRARACALAFFDLKDDEAIPARETPAEELFENPEHLRQIQDLPISSDERAALALRYREGKLNLEGHRSPLRPAKVVAMMLQVMTEEERYSGIVPAPGRVPTWSPEARKRFGKNFAFFSHLSKLLLTLARGESAKYLPTGRETALAAWASAQPYRAITLESLFRASYRLNTGDVYSTLMTIENILAEQWSTPERERLPITLRLKPFIHHLGKNLDNYGAWYHLFGILAYGYVSGLVRAETVATLETVGSHIMGGFADEHQEDHINSEGARIGQRLRHALLHGGWQKHRDDPTLLLEDSYLTRDEDYSRRLTH